MNDTVTNDEQASAYMEARLWEFIDMAAAFPKAKPAPRTWEHVLIYAPTPSTPAAEAAKPVCFGLDDCSSHALSVCSVRDECGKAAK